MNKLVRVIGSFIFSIIMYAVPILFAFSIAYKWNGFFIMLLSISAATQLLMLCMNVYDKSEDDEFK
jgi:hypothetical protein